MPSPSDTFDTFRNTLDPFIKSREHVNYIRRILTLHLGSEGGPIKQPVSLVDNSQDVTLGPELKGVQRELVEAIRANVTARQKYDDVSHINTSKLTPSRTVPERSFDIAEEQIGLLKLKNKQTRLSAVQEHLDLLMEKPAASPDFLDPEDMFHGAVSLPSVPKEVVNSLVAQQSTAKPDLKGQVAQLEKTVLRTKLLLRREEQLLQETRTRARSIPDVISNGTRFEALNATRNELINWIETELGKASGDEEGEDGEGDGQRLDRSSGDKATLDSQLKSIKEKYAKYLEARRLLLATMAERPDSSQRPVLKPFGNDSHVENDYPTPNAYLLIPYIESLLSVSRKQKAMITQKSHMNSVLSKQTKADSQTLLSIAEESHLLPAYPMQGSGSSRRRSVLGEVLTGPSPDSAGLKGKAQPWVFAADAAKIATLEKVAEKVEGGQVALESSMRALQEINHLLGQDQVDEVEEKHEEQAEDDFWLDTGSKHPTSVRKHTEKRKDTSKKPKDAWSKIHGDLGLIGQED